MALAGIDGVPKLAKRLSLPGLGQDNLYLVLAGKRPLARHELREIFEVCGLPIEFFTVDFASLEGAHLNSDGWLTATTKPSPNAIQMDDLFALIDEWAKARDRQSAADNGTAGDDDLAAPIADLDAELAREKSRPKGAGTGGAQDRPATRPGRGA
jgi:hypothetical protein